MPAQLPYTFAPTIGYQPGYQLRTGYSLANFIGDPTAGDISIVPSPWPTALSTIKYDAIALEPFTGSTIGAESSSYLTIAATAKNGPSPNAIPYVMEVWPPVSVFTSVGYQTYWAASVVDADATPMTLQLAAENDVLERVKLTYANARVIPVGDVFNAIDIAARAGQIPPLATVADMYVNDMHVGDMGNWATQLTVYETLGGVQLPANRVPSWVRFTGNGGPTMTNATAQKIADIVWSVVSTDARTGVH